MSRSVKKSIAIPQPVRDGLCAQIDNGTLKYSPVLLETIVELERFTGTCYRAANWIEVGTTKGRGKLEKNHRRILPLKSILTARPWWA